MGAKGPPSHPVPDSDGMSMAVNPGGYYGRPCEGVLTLRNLQDVERFERGIYTILLLLLVVLIALAVITLVDDIVITILSPPILLLTGDELLSLLGEFLIVFLAIELFESIRVYFRENQIHYELVVVIALTAIARKIILIDVDTTSDWELIGLGVIVIALAGAYYLLKRGGIAGGDTC